MQDGRGPRLLLDVSRSSYEVAIVPVPKLDMNRQQKIDKQSGQPMWSVKLYTLSEDGAAVFDVTVVSATPPSVAVRQPVVPVDLEALPWVNSRDGNVRNGVAYRASGLRPIEASAA